MITVRVRTSVGTYRLNDVASSDTFQRLKERLQSEHNAEVIGNLSLEAKSSKSSAVADTTTVGEAKLVNGHMLHADVSAGTKMAGTTPAAVSASGTGKMTTIGKDGSIVVSEVTSSWASGLLGSSLLTKSGMKNTTSILNGKKRVALYFSAHWCPPCRQFTPLLATFYEQLQEEDASALEIVFVSSDHDEGSFLEYYGEMPWLAVPHSDRATASALGERFGVKGIPALIVLDGTTGNVKDADGRRTLVESRGDPTRALSRW